jgi:hypothetical protein
MSEAALRIIIATVKNNMLRNWVRNETIAYTEQEARASSAPLEAPSNNDTAPKLNIPVKIIGATCPKACLNWSLPMRAKAIVRLPT